MVIEQILLRETQIKICAKNFEIIYFSLNFSNHALGRINNKYNIY